MPTRARRLLTILGGGLSAPAAPTSLTATAVSSTQINLAWTDNSLNETGFNIYRGGALIDTVAADETTYSDTGLTPNALYEYYVTAENAAGESDPSNTDSATTGVVLTLQPDATAGLDTQLNSGAATTNYGTASTFQERQADFRSLVKFDLSAIPAGSTIVSATYSLWNQFTNATNVTITLHRIKAANSGWTEAAATWNTIEGSTAWAGSAGCSTAGTDYETTPIGTITFVGGTALDTEIQTSLNAAQLQAMLTANYGWVGIRPVGGSPSTVWRSSDVVTAGLRPKLVVEYIAP